MELVAPNGFTNVIVSRSRQAEHTRPTGSQDPAGKTTRIIIGGRVRGNEPARLSHLVWSQDSAVQEYRPTLTLKPSLKLPTARFSAQRPFPIHVPTT